MTIIRDWRDHEGKSYISLVKDQSSCGSCGAFGIIGAAEALYLIHKKLDIDLSEGQLFFCGGGLCDRGSNPRQLLDYFKEKGIQTEDVFPYRPADMICYRADEAAIYKIASWHSSFFYDWKTSIKSNGPLSATMVVYEDFLSYKGGIYEHIQGKYLGMHQIAVVGLGRDDKGYYWICKNSWGTGWGEDGFFRTREAMMLYEIKLNGEDIKPKLPDLVINSARLKYSPMFSKIEFIISNIGTETSPPCYLNVDIGRKVSSYRIWSIAPLSERVIAARVEIVPNSIINIVATIDPYEQVEEEHEGNNIRRYQLVSQISLEEV